MKTVAVIGGGAAGVAAAWRLVERGARVTLFERADEVGGRARSETLSGCVVDVGAQLFGSGFSALFQHARETGTANLLVRSPGRDALRRNGRNHPIAYGSITSMVTSSALPASLKLRLGTRYVPYLVRHGPQLDASDPVRAGGDALDGPSVAAWGARELGDDFVELLAYPLLGAYYGSPPEETSAVLYHALARAGMDVSVYAVRGGTGSLMRGMADAAAQRGAEIRTGTAVDRLVVHGDVVQLTAAETTHTFDAAVIALPAPQAAEIFEFGGALKTWLDAVRFASSAVLAVVIRERLGADFFGLSLLRGDAATADLVAVCVESQKAAGLVPADRDLLVCLSAPAASAELLAQPEAGVERMLAALEHIFPGARQRIEHVKLYRHTHGYPLFYPGYLKHLRVFPAHELPSNIALAGDYLVAPTVEGALRSGDAAARRLLG